MTTLRVVVDPLLGPAPTALGRYTREMTRAIIDAAPRDCDVDGLIAAAADEAQRQIRADLPGLHEIHSGALAPRELAIAWQLGIVGSSGSGLVHAPSLLAPLRRHDRSDGDQISVTVHDVFAWTHPEWLGTAAVAADKALLRRARKHADAVVVTSHALADELAEIADFGDRIRVIPGAGRNGLNLPFDAMERSEALNLPSTYILTSGSLHSRDGIEPLAAGLSRNDIGLPLLVLDAVAPEPSGDGAAPEHSLPHVRFLGELDDADRAVVLSRARVYVHPVLDGGSDGSIIDAMRFGIPVVQSDVPALVELSGDATVVVERDDIEGYPDRLAGAIADLVKDDQRARTLGVIGSDRAKQFSWRDAGASIWQLHAEL